MSSSQPNAPAASSPRPGPSKTARRNRSRRWLPWLLGLILVSLILIGLLPRPEVVETAQVSRGPLQTTITEEGETRIRERYLVSSPITGRLRRIPLKAGDAVKADTTMLAVIDPTPPAPLDARSRSLAEARRDAVAAQLEKARTAHQFAQGDLARFERLFRENTVSRQELESFQLREAATARELAAAESALREAEAELASVAPLVQEPGAAGPPVEIRSPASGRVLRVLEEHSRVISAGTPLLEVGDPEDLEVVIDVLSRDAAIIQPGAAVEFHQWGGEIPLQGRVRHVEPAAFTKVSALGVEEQRVNVIADFLAPPEERPGLGDQFRVEARIVLRQVDDTTKVASGALFRQNQGWAVFVIEAGRAQRRPVRVGISSPSESQILEGLNASDTVILYPGDRIRDGARVRPVTISP